MEAALSGHTGTLCETGPSHSLLENKDGSRGQTESQELGGETDLRREEDLGLVKEAGVGWTEETVMGRDVGLQLNAGTTGNGGGMETGQVVCGEMGAEQRTRVDQMMMRMDEEAGTPSEFLSCASPCQKEEVMEEECNVSEEEDELGMDTGDSAQGEELTLRC